MTTEVAGEEDVGPRPTPVAFAAGVGVLCELLLGAARVSGQHVPQTARAASAGSQGGAAAASVATAASLAPEAAAGAEASASASSTAVPEASPAAGSEGVTEVVGPPNGLLHLSESRTLRSVLCRLLAAVNLYQPDAATVAGHLIRCLELLTRPEVLDGHPASKGSAPIDSSAVAAATEGGDSLVDVQDDDILGEEVGMGRLGALAAAFEGHESADLQSEPGDSEAEQAIAGVDAELDAQVTGAAGLLEEAVLEDEHDDDGGMHEESEEGDEEFMNEDGEDGEDGELGAEGVDHGELDEDDPEAAMWADTDGEDSDQPQDDGISFILDLGDGRSRVVGRSSGANTGSQMNVQDAAGRAFQVLTSLGIPGFGGHGRQREFTIASRPQHWGFQGELDLPESHPLLAGHAAGTQALGPGGPHGWLALRTPYGFESVTIGPQGGQQVLEQAAMPPFAAEAAAAAAAAATAGATNSGPSSQAARPSWDTALVDRLAGLIPELPPEREGADPAIGESATSLAENTASAAPSPQSEQGLTQDLKPEEETPPVEAEVEAEAESEEADQESPEVEAAAVPESAPAATPDPGRDFGVPSLRALAASLSMPQETVLDAAGVDAQFLEELPLDLRDEIVSQQLRTIDLSALRSLAVPSVGAAAEGAPAQQDAGGVRSEDSGEISQDVLDHLPPDIRAEVLAEQARERAAVATPAAPADPAQAQDMDTASFIATLTPELRQEVMLSMTEEVLRTLPPELVAEAQLVRERVQQRAARAQAVADHEAFTQGMPTSGWLLGGDAPARGGRSGSGGSGGAGAGHRAASTAVVLTSSAGHRRSGGGGGGGETHMASTPVDLIQLLRGHLSGFTTLVRQQNGSSSRRHESRSRERPAPPRLDARTVARFGDSGTELPIELHHSATVCRLLFLRRSVSRPLMERFLFNLAAHPQSREAMLRQFLKIVIWQAEDSSISEVHDQQPRFLFGPAKVEADADGAELGALEAYVAPHVAQQVSGTRVLGFLSYLLPRIPHIAEFFCKRLTYREIMGGDGSKAAGDDSDGEAVINLLIRHTALSRWPNCAVASAGQSHVLLLVLKSLLVAQSTTGAPPSAAAAAAATSTAPATQPEEGGPTQPSQPSAESQNQPQQAEADTPAVIPSWTSELHALLTRESAEFLCSHLCSGAPSGGAEPRAVPVVAALLRGEAVDAALKSCIREQLLRHVQDTASKLQATLSASTEPYGVQLHAAGNETCFLQLVQTLQAFFLEVHNASPTEEAPVADAAAALQTLLLDAKVDGVWTALDAAMGRAVEQWTGLEGASATRSGRHGHDGPGASPPPPLLHTLLPLIEAFFLAHSGTAGNDATANAAGTSSVPLGPAGSPVADTADRGFGIASDETATLPTRSAVEVFGDKHRKALNALVRQSPGLLSSSFSTMVESVPWALDFDNKRHYLRQRLRQLRGDMRYDVVRLHVRRSEVFMDSYHQLRMRSGDEMRGKLSVSFVGEEGMDAGGVSREWFKILAREIFNPNYGLFTQAGGKACTFHPSKTSYVNPDHLYFFQFIGRIIGKALFDGHHLEAYFTRSFYKHMLRRKVNYQDMEALDPDYYRNLRWMLDNSIEGDITDMLGHLTFTAESEEFGRVKTVELKPGGATIPVTDSNKREYVQLMCEHKMTKSVQSQIDAFLKGFHELVPPTLITLFDDKELELLISGLPEIDIEDLRRNTEYHNYSESTPQIQWFWKALGEFSKEHKAWFLQFVTGTSQVPLEGFKGLIGMRGPQKFSIHRAEGGERLPTAHTCFNQLDLPEYSTEDQLCRKLVQAVHEAHEGFGFV